MSEKERKERRENGRKETNPNLNDSVCIYNTADFETDHLQVEFLENAKRIDDLTIEKQPLVVLWYKNLQCMCVAMFAFMQLYHTTHGALYLYGKYKVYSILSDVHLTVYVTTPSSIIKHF